MSRYNIAEQFAGWYPEGTLLWVEFNLEHSKVVEGFQKILNKVPRF
jgi:hypothetical protein